jgi:hypothetical protein
MLPRLCDALWRPRTAPAARRADHRFTLNGEVGRHFDGSDSGAPRQGIGFFSPLPFVPVDSAVVASMPRRRATKFRQSSAEITPMHLSRTLLEIVYPFLDYHPEPERERGILMFFSTSIKHQIDRGFGRPGLASRPGFSWPATTDLCAVFHVTTGKVSQPSSLNGFNEWNGWNSANRLEQLDLAAAKHTHHTPAGNAGQPARSFPYPEIL